jgi:hypothetical protein
MQQKKLKILYVHLKKKSFFEKAKKARERGNRPRQLTPNATKFVIMINLNYDP